MPGITDHRGTMKYNTIVKLVIHNSLVKTSCNTRHMTVKANMRSQKNLMTLANEIPYNFTTEYMEFEFNEAFKEALYMHLYEEHTFGMSCKLANKNALVGIPETNVTTSTTGHNIRSLTASRLDCCSCGQQNHTGYVEQLL